MMPLLKCSGLEKDVNYHSAEVALLQFHSNIAETIDKESTAAFIPTFM